MNSIIGKGIKILGAVFLRVTVTDESGRLVEAAIMAYVTESTTRFYLSKQVMGQLGVIGPNFPAIKASQAPEVASATESCGCPKHTKPPPRPEKLPFAPLPENIDRMK